MLWEYRFLSDFDRKMNLLGKVDAWDNLIRIKSESIVQELMGMILKEFCDNDVTSSPVTL